VRKITWLGAVLILSSMVLTQTAQKPTIKDIIGKLKIVSSDGEANLFMLRQI
jgi:hypothetical protein